MKQKIQIYDTKTLIRASCSLLSLESIHTMENVLIGIEISNLRLIKDRLIAFIILNKKLKSD